MEEKIDKKSRFRFKIESLIYEIKFYVAPLDLLRERVYSNTDAGRNLVATTDQRCL